MRNMYEINKFYRFKLKDGDYYTGYVMEEDENFIKVITIKNEDIIISKDNIKIAKPYGGNQNG